jgi:plastocyanin domain-containing protein
MDVLVIVAALAAIAWVNWYFLFSTRTRPAATAEVVGGVQDVTIVVEGGYTPSHVTVRKGQQVRLQFDRRETSPCSEEIVIPDFGVRRFLPAHETTVVEFTPQKAGTFDFMCGMGMLHGRLTVEE